MFMWICLSKKSKKCAQDRALYYSYDIGKRRMYRSGYPEPDYSTFRLLAYKRKENAQFRCDVMNEAFFEDFEPVLVSEEEIEKVRKNAVALKQWGKEDE